jgi:hypothetical protein
MFFFHEFDPYAVKVEAGGEFGNILQYTKQVCDPYAVKVEVVGIW